jgi:hypothetical protein
MAFDADSIEAMAYDPVHHRLACTSHSGKLRLLQLERAGKPEPLYFVRNTHVLNGPGNLVKIFNVDNGKGIPRAVIFGSGQRVAVYCLRSGEQ